MNRERFPLTFFELGTFSTASERPNHRTSTELKDTLKSADYKSRDASNDLLQQLGLVEGEIGAKLEYLKSCDDYCNQEACHAIMIIEGFWWSITPGQPKEKMCSMLVDFVLEQGLGQLMVKMLVPLTSLTDERAFEFRHKLQNVILYLVFTSKKLRVQVELEQ